MTLTQAPGAGGPIETWIASPPDAADGPIADRRRRPRRAARAPGRRPRTSRSSCSSPPATASSCRTSADPPRTAATGSGRSWATGAASMRPTSTRRSITSSSSGLADTDRLGVLGLSYGGFMVNWLVGTTDRFAAAVSENGVTNQISDWANSDSGPEYDRCVAAGRPVHPRGHREALAPVPAPPRGRHPDAAADAPGRGGPALSAAGQRAALHRPAQPPTDRGVRPLPNEAHVYGNAGRPDRRIDRQTRMLDWFDRYLRG